MKPEQQAAHQQGTSDQGQAAAAYVVAPCPHDGKCPMEGTRSWCHFAQRFQRSDLQRRHKVQTGLDLPHLSLACHVNSCVKALPERIPIPGHSMASASYLTYAADPLHCAIRSKLFTCKSHHHVSCSCDCTLPVLSKTLTCNLL